MSKQPEPTEEPPQIIFMVTTIFGHNTRKGLVNVTVGGYDFHAQMLPADARALALNLSRAADAAETDEFLVGFLEKRIGADPAAIAGILTEFREWREEHEEK